MLKLIVLVHLLILSGSAQGNRNTANRVAAEVRCSKTHGMPLFLKVKTPSDEHGPAAREILREELPCLVLECTRKGDMLAYVSKQDAKKLLGGHAVYRTVKGAGNSAHTDALFVEIRPASFVPEILKEHVERLVFHDDPKLGYTGPAAKRCDPHPPR